MPISGDGRSEEKKRAGCVIRSSVETMPRCTALGWELAAREGGQGAGGGKRSKERVLDTVKEHTSEKGTLFRYHGEEGLLAVCLRGGSIRAGGDCQGKER